MTRALWLVPLAALLAACPPPIDLPDGGDDNTLIVGPAGGLFVRAGYAVNVPAGAFDEEQRIFVTITDTGVPEVPNRKRISLGYRLSPSSLVPRSPLTLYLPWDPNRLVAGVDPGTYDMRRQAGTDAYLALPGAKTNTMPFEAVEARTDRLGLFWVTSPIEPNIDRLELEPAEATLRVGETQQFSARVVSPTGASLEVPVTWSVVPARVGGISDGGLFTALDPGVATLTATAGAQSASAKIAVIGTTVGPVTYAHENPFPTGNDLLGAAFAPGGLGTVYAGDNGTVLVESAAGAWSRAFSSPALTLKAAAGTSLTNAVAIGTSGFSGVLVEFRGGAMPPAVRIFQPTAISDLSHLWFDGTHGMGVGSGNELVIYRGGAWVTERHPSFEALLSVIGDGQGGFVVVGDLGSVYKWDPTRNVWDSLYDTRLAVKLDAARLVDASTGEGWAVGGGRLWHFTGTGWTAENLPPTPLLDGATSLGVVEGRVVVGARARLSVTPLPPSRGVLLIRDVAAPTDGGLPEVTWTSQPLRGQQVPRGIFAANPSSGEARVVGTFGAVWAWDSMQGRFVEKSRGFQGDVADLAVTENDVYAAVNECADVRCTSRVGVVMHRGPEGFEPLGSLTAGGPVRAIVARSDTEVLVSTPTGVSRWDGTSWSSVPVSGLQGPILDLQWCGNDLWGAGEGGTVYRGTAALLNTAGGIASAPLQSLHCRSADEVWVAGNGFLASRPASGPWTTRASQQVRHADWRAVWSPGLGEGFAFNDARYGVYWDTRQLLAQESTGPIAIDVATAMWGDRIDNLYMAGLSSLPSVFGFLLRFNGVNWSLVDAGAHRRGTALTGRSTTEIWLGTEGGGVLKAVPPN